MCVCWVTARINGPRPSLDSFLVAGDGDEEVTNYESTAVFQPVVQLQEVETKTHEEEEDALYKQ